MFVAAVSTLESMKAGRSVQPLPSITVSMLARFLAPGSILIMSPGLARNVTLTAVSTLRPLNIGTLEIAWMAHYWNTAKKGRKKRKQKGFAAGFSLVQ